MGYYLDVTLAVLILLVGVRGFYNGFIDEVAGLVGIVVGVFLASRFAGVVGTWFSLHVYNLRNESMSALVGFVLVLACVWIAFLILGVLVSKAVSLSNLGIIDRILGFVFSCTKMFLVFAFLLYGISKLSFMKGVDAYLRSHSQIYPYMQEIASHIMQLQEVQEIGKMIQQKPRGAGQNGTKEVQKSLEPPKNPLDKTIQEKIHL